MKRSKIKRSHLKRFSSAVVHVGRGPNRDMVSEANSRAAYKSDEEIMKMLTLHRLNPSEAFKETRQRIKEISNNKPTINHICVSRGKRLRKYIFYSDKRDCAFIVEVNFFRGFIRYSQTYHSLDRAKAIYTTNNIQWLVSTPLPESANPEALPPLPNLG